MTDNEKLINKDLETLIRARYSIIYIVSWEEKRVEEAIRTIAEDRGKKTYFWSVTQGINLNPDNLDEATKDPLEALDFIMKSSDQAIFVMRYFHAYMSDGTIIRRLRDLSTTLKTSYKTLIILSPILKLPQELEKEITVVDYPLPDAVELGMLLDGIVDLYKESKQVNVAMTPEERERVLKAAQGLTANEAENVFAKSLVEKRSFDVDTILTEKEQIVRKSGMLEYYRTDENFVDIGGMDILKKWLDSRSMALSEKARDFGLPQPKGILLLGVQGCGKSLCCKAIASQWRLPLLRFDIGTIFSGIVGSSEANMRRAINIAESVAPAILWVDELDKGLSGTQSSTFSDAGTASRVFGYFVTWLQEKTAPVFVVATANDISQLPPEVLRKGRFDELFFVDLPSGEERREIFEIHLKKRLRDPSRFDLKKLAAISAGFSGAEIEQVVIDGLYTAFQEGRDLATEDVLECISRSVPLSTTMKENIEELREWAFQRCRMASSSPTQEVLPAKTRKLEL